MSAQQNTDVVKRGYAAFDRGDIEELLDLLAGDIEWTTPSVEGMPYGGKHKGRAEVGGFFKSLSQAEDVLEFTQENFIAQDDKVAVTGRYRAKVKSTGRIIDTPFVHVFDISEGKVRGFVEHLDTAAIADAYRQRGSATA